MDIQIWLNGITQTNFIPYDGDRGGQVVAGLDFIHAIEWHMKWRHDLEAFVAGQSAPVSQAVNVSRDDACQLGQWLHGEGDRIYGMRPDFQQLVQEHAHFHLCAADLLETYRSEKTCPDYLRQDFLHSSELVLKQLAQLYLSLIGGQFK